MMRLDLHTLITVAFSATADISVVSLCRCKQKRSRPTGAYRAAVTLNSDVKCKVPISALRNLYKTEVKPSSGREQGQGALESFIILTETDTSGVRQATTLTASSLAWLMVGAQRHPLKDLNTRLTKESGWSCNDRKAHTILFCLGNKCITAPQFLMINSQGLHPQMQQKEISMEHLKESPGVVSEARGVVFLDGMPGSGSVGRFRWNSWWQRSRNTALPSGPLPPGSICADCPVKQAQSQ
ncbi:hypothetical protein EYF80_023481 [Liparis tanakae]|uniref:Uncharacterized protein n=1 Tax=Liparis tanakae TaxID=230148 RepID=A0A4Z2HKE4_9TELE|nr:hypothetical protein EYF80_023481 [Liparis tanakae]